MDNNFCGKCGQELNKPSLTEINYHQLTALVVISKLIAEFDNLDNTYRQMDAINIAKEFMKGNKIKLVK